MKKFLFIILFVLFLECEKGNSLSPYTMIYENGREKYIFLEREVRFEIPTSIEFLDKCNPKNEYINDSTKISVESYAIHQSEIEYMNPEVFGKSFLSLMKQKNFKIDKASISELIQKNKSETILYYGQRDYSVPNTYSVFKYNGNIVGESQWYSSKLDSKFICPLIEFDLYFVVFEYLVYVKIKYENENDYSICKNFPDYFVKKQDGFSWKSEAERGAFFKCILSKSVKKHSSVLDSIIAIQESILKTIYIK